MGFIFMWVIPIIIAYFSVWIWNRTKRKIVLLSIFGFMVLLVISSVIFDELNKPKKLVESTKSYLMHIRLQLESYKESTGNYPTTVQGINALITRPANVSGWFGPYLPYERNDSWGNHYRYRYPRTKGRPFDLWSAGPDGKDGTEDDISWPLPLVN
jgi:general secretion pathway protein G